MAGPKFTIVTACFNSSATIRETLESVASQDFRDFEHWVIDGGSKDDTIEIVKQFPHVKWISEKDKGHYEAMNKIFKTYFPHGGPARTTVAVAGLPGNSMVEINCIAAVTRK